MTTYIDRVVTEVVVKPSTAEGGEEADKRWHDDNKVESVFKTRERMDSRLSAEGFDD